MTGSSLRWSRAALEDLLDIYVAIGLDNVRAAERVYDRLQKRTDVLRRQPRIGPRRADIRAAMRVLVETPYLIFYETMPDTDDGPVESVQIVRVVDGRRDLGALF